MTITPPGWIDGEGTPPEPPAPTKRRWLVPVLAATAAVVVVALAVVTTLLVTKQDAPPAAASATTTHTVHPVPVPETHSAPTVADGGLFDKFMRDEGFTVYATPSDLNSLASAVCTGFDAGLTFAQVMDSMNRVGWGEAMSGRFIGFAVASHCPRNSGKTQ